MAIDRIRVNEQSSKTVMFTLKDNTNTVPSSRVLEWHECSRVLWNLIQARTPKESI